MEVYTLSHDGSMGRLYICLHSFVDFYGKLVGRYTYQSHGWYRYTLKLILPPFQETDCGYLVAESNDRFK